jgi:hypothetical protein
MALTAFVGQATFFCRILVLSELTFCLDIGRIGQALGSFGLCPALADTE